MGLLTVLVVTVVLVADLRRPSAPAEPDTISGPYASLLRSSTDLGPARTAHVQLTAALRDSSRPDLLMGWAQHEGLSVRWRPGDSWAILEGAPTAVAGAFDVEV
ncbi:MAG TPA: peptidase S53, partial [Mycobacterium sp.]|nr:peptidase S53 [Mycobacterium sp.]